MRSELEEKVRDFAIDEGILGKKVPENPKLDFGYELKYPPNSPKPLKLICIKAKDRKAIVIQVATQISQPHQEQLDKNNKQGLRLFFNIFRKYILNQNLLYNFDLKKSRYIISDTIYPDGMTQHEFFKTIRRVFNTAIFMNMTLGEIIAGGMVGKSAEGDIDPENFVNGDFMFS